MKESNETVNTKATIDQPGVRIDSDGPVSLGTLTTGGGKASSVAVNQLTTGSDRFDGSANISRIDSPTATPVKQYTSENVTPEDLEVIRKEWALPDIESARAFIKQRDLERLRRETSNTSTVEGIDSDHTESHLVKEPTIKAAVGRLTQALRDDPSYAWGWHCNIAMAMRDSGCDALVAQKGAALFLRILTMDENGNGLDITASEEYTEWMEQYHAAQNKPT